MCSALSRRVLLYLFVALLSCLNLGGASVFNDNATDLFAASQISDGEICLLQRAASVKIYEVDKSKVSNAAKEMVTDTDNKEWEDIMTVTPRTAADAAGVSMNHGGDLWVYLTGLATDVAIIIGIFIGFMFLRQAFPIVYSHNLEEGWAPCNDAVKQFIFNWFGWVRASFYYTTEEAVDAIGLDQTMLLEFTNFSMRTLAMIGVPMLLIIGPMNAMFGGSPALKADPPKFMSIISFGNVENGSWLYWVHAFVVWYVVIIVTLNIDLFQQTFLKRRFEWLERLPNDRARTILVEGIPEDKRSDDLVRQYFNNIFEHIDDSGKTYDVVDAVYTLKDCTKLAGLVSSRDAAAHGLAASEARWSNTEPPNDPDKRPTSFWGGTDLITYYTDEKNKFAKELEEERKRVEDEAKTPGGVNCPSAFVTFSHRKYAQMAATQFYSPDKDVWVVTDNPPDPGDLIWSDLQLTPVAGRTYDFFGYAAIVGLYFAFLPIILGIDQTASYITFLPGPLNDAWQSLATSIGLTIMVTFLPTFLMLIYVLFFQLKADAWAQKRLQNSYFLFQLVFVILVVAIGPSVGLFMKAVLTDPWGLPDLLGSALPDATHFYIDFITFFWVTHCLNLLRYVQLGKYLAYRTIFPPLDAKRLAEPEDQDYYGIGSRSARFTINLGIGIVFGTLSPPINLVTWINFAICRLVYGYLMAYAECKKKDLGGVFWIDQMNHVYILLIVYCIVMCGVLTGRCGITSGPTPTWIAAPSIIWAGLMYYRFYWALGWEYIPIEDIVLLEQERKAGNKPPPSGTLEGRKYTQPELRPWTEWDDLQRQKSENLSKRAVSTVTGLASSFSEAVAEVTPGTSST